jgi:peroxiredoxin
VSLRIGQPFPDFRLGTVDTSTVRSRGPLLLVFWKANCPACELALPYYNRIYRLFPDASVIGVCQNSPEETAENAAKLGLEFEQLSDADFKVSRSADIEVVPTAILTGPSGRVLDRMDAWDRSAIEALGEQLARITGEPPTQIVQDTESVPAFNPG